jgi:hypothetical protein
VMASGLNLNGEVSSKWVNLSVNLMTIIEADVLKNTSRICCRNSILPIMSRPCRFSGWSTLQGAWEKWADIWPAP